MTPETIQVQYFNAPKPGKSTYSIKDTGGRYFFLEPPMVPVFQGREGQLFSIEYRTSRKGNDEFLWINKAKHLEVGEGTQHPPSQMAAAPQQGSAGIPNPGPVRPAAVPSRPNGQANGRGFKPYEGPFHDLPPTYVQPIAALINAGIVQNVYQLGTWVQALGRVAKGEFASEEPPGPTPQQVHGDDDFNDEIPF
jgi:hypothetical protein